MYRAIRILCVMMLLSACFAFAQTEFSADVIQSNKTADHGTKVYCGKDKMRFEGVGDARSGGSGAVIFDLNKDTWTVLMDKQHMYMEMPSKMMENRGMFHFFKTGDVENACAEWQALDANKGGTCRKVGDETVNGRNAVKYEGTNSEGKRSTVWLDSRIRFPLKWEDKDGGGELQNIKEGPQPSSLFTVPSDYKKFDMSGMQHQ